MYCKQTRVNQYEILKKKFHKEIRILIKWRDSSASQIIHPDYHLILPEGIILIIRSRKIGQFQHSIENISS